MQDGQSASGYHPDRAEEDAQDLELEEETESKTEARTASFGLGLSNASWPNGAVILILLVTSAQNLSLPNRHCLRGNAPVLTMPALPRLPRRKGKRARAELPLKSVALCFLLPR
jgi:hypothetical protein